MALHAGAEPFDFSVYAIYGCHMQKTTLYMDEETYRRLKQLARREGRAPAEMVREAVAE